MILLRLLIEELTANKQRLQKQLLHSQGMDVF